MKRTKIRSLDINKEGSIIEIFEIRDDQYIIRLNGIRHMITKPKGKTWKNIKVSIGDRIKVKKVYSNDHVDKLLFVSKQKITRVQNEERTELSKTEKKIKLDEDCEEVLRELEKENNERK